jgi:hypothetical protein
MFRSRASVLFISETTESISVYADDVERFLFRLVSVEYNPNPESIFISFLKNNLPYK